MEITAPTLSGRLVSLEQLRPEDHDDLVEAATDGQLWNLWYTTVPDAAGMAAEIERRLALQEAGSMIPFTVRDSTGRALGMTTYMNIDRELPRVEIGSTWNRASAHGTGTNPESKLLLLTHAFEVLECPAVEFRTHWMNHQSREAIERLGAKLDGVLRSHLRMADGSLRDTAVYSIIATEWPQVRAELVHRLRRH
ncbi:GNAT family N-acetyltransferase [Ornithinicoccus hortensis]|uniref:RimJ/RimL family protein N-acetyltransferase n=1 Tax=Ornithinicoccus hortensis TaxID=82346 RepID=A0A542YWM7_9MICO|nr:GNAT family protein [Ornithinicoccus hortensis]TQL52463.1 RimJ/RimL family protein N-acetyltransferase [Ornithinicoccus hortensis]